MSQNNHVDRIAPIPHSPLTTWIVTQTGPTQRVERSMICLQKGNTYYEEITMIRIFEIDPQAPHIKTLTEIRVIEPNIGKVKYYTPKAEARAHAEFWKATGELIGAGYIPTRPHGPSLKEIRKNFWLPKFPNQMDKINQWEEEEAQEKEMMDLITGAISRMSELADRYAKGLTETFNPTTRADLKELDRANSARLNTLRAVKDYMNGDRAQLRTLYTGILGTNQTKGTRSIK